jgi:hypothetical protein
MRANLPSRFVVILGTNEIASAVAVQLRRGGYRVVLSHDPLVPVLRRKMAFHDALFDEAVTIEGMPAKRADSGLEIRTLEAPGVIITELGLLDLIVIQALDILLDARMQKCGATPDLRRLAGLAIGLGPGFAGGINCDIAIETQPGKAGLIIRQGEADPPDGLSQRLGDRGNERFIRAAFAGRWNTAIEIGTMVFKDFIIGHLRNVPVRAPFDGVLRGVIRDGTEVPAGVKLLEIDPRRRRANWTEADQRTRLIAAAVKEVISAHQANVARTRTSSLHLVRK